MAGKEPNILQMMRAPFLSSILSPLIAGTIIAVFINQSFSLFGFILVLIMGIGLHAATNVYNDIYDTLQGTDRVNKHRNEFSGGSGIIVQFPHLEQKMYWLARISLLVALAATAVLMFVVQRELWPHLWVLYLLSAFFSKYYTAAPIKLAYRGLGEVSVWFAFGPMAIMVAAVSQNVGFDPLVIAAMPLTGISTMSILLIGQMIDYAADKEGGKWGVAVRLGPKFTASLYLFVQIVLILNTLYLSLLNISANWPLFFVIIPYLIFLPRIVKISSKSFDQPDELKPAAGMNVQLHLLFSVLLSIGLVLMLILR